jgi:hypothetical protein
MGSSKSQLTEWGKTALLWKNKENTCLEYFTLLCRSHFFVLEGTIVLLLEKLPSKITYKIVCNSDWRTRYVHVLQQRSVLANQLTLEVSDDQFWVKNNTPLPFANGLFDVDFEVSPATNTLPISRLGLKVGESRELDGVWVRFPSLKLERLRQRYTRLSSGCYKYEAPALVYEACLEVDDASLIVNYGNLWTRIT